MSDSVAQSETCTWLVRRHDIVGIDSFTVREGEDIFCECLRTIDHQGPHLIKRLDRIGGQYIVWEQDCCELGTCEDCDGEDPMDYCLVYGEVSEEVALMLIADGSLES